MNDKKPEVGEVWEEIDGRRTRKVKIVSVGEERVTILGTRLTSAKLSRFNGRHGGYRYCGQSPE